MKKTILFLSLCTFGLWSCGSDAPQNNAVSNQAPAQEQPSNQVNPDEVASTPASSSSSSEKAANFDFMGSKVLNFQSKTKENATTRTQILDLIRASVYLEYKQEFEFVVKHLKIANGYAWFKGEAQRKDGKPVELEEDSPFDCCHVEALLKYSDGKWYLVESAAFSTDVWYDGIVDRIKGVPQSIFQD